MNIFDFLQTGGFPFETDTLHEMQAAYNIFNAFGALAGDKTIISGCAVTGSTVSDGVVYLNGEVFNFVGGNEQATVRIIETPTSKVFEDGSTKEVLKKRHVTFASGVGAINWSEFTRLDSLKNINSRILPPGTNPQLYSGAIANIPTGWQLCDGTNNTPDLRGQFIVGYNPNDTDYNAIGKTGGEKEVTLTEQQMPSHSHTGSTSTNGAHTHTHQRLKVATKGESKNDAYYRVHGSDETGTTSSAGNHSHTLSTNNTGGGQGHENRPPFYTLAYIIYTG
ncbi:phage baseplate protein [Pseudotamlana carrageenivorans]|uniref:Baseplate structural protein Gp10 C-terminal domain-containing protein n=1 Tax=Pseudotamlana carrageenivorans TaxID=2069432 RepID=A0A2I7SF00_9FLAO|nr:hypothetical protein [Tamlana carrageenivorans]AUS04476.1 hypothetical protein C1A40_02860 [Tamlana carrageenivorans]